MISHLSLSSAVAWAVDVPTEAAAGAANPIMSFLPIIAIFAVMYFLMIRPQQKKQKAHQAMLNAVQKGDKIQTNGGVIGTVTGLDANELTVEIAPQVRVKIGRGFVARVIRPTVENPAK